MARTLQSLGAMRLSGFNLYVDDYPDQGDTLIHNTLTGSYVVLSSTELDILRRADRGEPLSEDEREVVGDPDLADPDVGIVVDSREEEERAFRAWLEARRSRRELQVILSINLACNFDCPYCCQAEVMSGKAMSREHADATAQWLAEHAREHDLDSVSLIFCGGEPLLHPERLKRIADGVRRRLGDTQTEVRIGLITNGYYLDEAMVQDLATYGLASVQVTLDGDEHTHHLTRVSKSGENTFWRIFENVKAASRHIRVNINGNYQDDTIHGFAPLLRRLAEAELPAETRVTFSEALSALAAPEGAGSGACTGTPSSTSRQMALTDEVWSRGFSASLPHQVGPCDFFDHHAFAVDPEGRVYKCPGFLGHPEWAIGHVSTGLTSRYHRMLNQNPQRLCGTCEHRPNCTGGCVAAQWTSLGRAEGVNCEKTYLDHIVDQSLVRGYLFATAGSREEALTALESLRDETGRENELHERRGHRPSALQVVA